MLHRLLAVVTLIGIALVPAAFASDDAAQAAYGQGQTLKRSNQFSAARAAFEEAAALSDASKWSALAADEMRYGLPLHESNVLLVQLAGATDHPTRARLLARLDALYQSIIDANPGNVARIGEIENRRDQVALLGQSARSAESTSLKEGLDQLRYSIQRYHIRHGRWPSRRELEAEVTSMLQATGQAPGRLQLFDFYPASTSFFATLRDSRGGPDIKLKGDGGQVRIEGAGL